MDVNDRTLGLRLIGSAIDVLAPGVRNLTKLIEWLRSPDADVPRAYIPAFITQLASLQAALAARLLEPSTAETEYLTLRQLAQRTGIGKSTVRKMMSEEFEEGVHFIRNGRKLLFMWPSVDAQIRALRTRGPRQTPEILQPFVRRGRHRA